MRCVVLLFGLTGCQLVFPLRDAPAVDGSVDLSNPTATTIVKTQAIAGEDNQLIVTVVGTPDARVAYDLQIDQGEPDRVDNQLELDGEGTGSASHAWTPSKLGRVAIDTRGDYDLTVASPDVTHVDAEVFERFGNTDGDVETLNQLGAGLLVAVPIVLPGTTRIERLSIHILASEPDTMGMLGLYSGLATPTTSSPIPAPSPSSLRSRSSWRSRRNVGRSSSRKTTGSPLSRTRPSICPSAPGLRPRSRWSTSGRSRCPTRFPSRAPCSRRRSGWERRSVRR